MPRAALARAVGLGAAPGVMWALGCVGGALLHPKPARDPAHHTLGEGAASPRWRAGAPGPFQRGSPCGRGDKVREGEATGI